jgi:subtilisin family serine protease
MRDGAPPVAAARRAAATVGEQVGPSLHRLHVAAGQERAAAVALRADPSVAAAAPNYVRRAQVTPNDALFTYQWGLRQIDAPGAWNVQRGAPGVVIAVLDSGVDPGHPDLAGKLLPGANVLAVDPAPPDAPTTCPANPTVRDDFDHGTHVSGIAAAQPDNGVGVAGVAWEPLILPIKVLDCTGNGSDAQIIAGIDYAISHGAWVINLSFGGPGDSAVLDAAVERAWRAGIVVVAAAGNAGSDVPYYPAASPHALAISATDQSDRFVSSFTPGGTQGSNFGSWVSLAAPGVSILSTYPTYMPSWHIQPGYQFKDGTSMAAPFVSGVAALLFSLHPTYPPDRIAGLMFISADRLTSCPGGCAYDEHGRNDYYGHGRVNAARAVRIAQAIDLPLVLLRRGP